MGALSSQFGHSLSLAIITAVVVLMTMALVARRVAGEGRPVHPDVFRVAALGWAVVIVVATALPQVWPPRLSADGDLVLEVGRGGLGEWRAILDDPLSWTSFLLVANVAVYVPFGFLGVLGWPARAAQVVLAGTVISLLVEISHFTLTERVASTDDVILNATGVVLGAALAVAAVRVRAGTTGGPARS